MKKLLEKNPPKVENKFYFYAFLFVTFVLGALVLWPVKDLVMIAWVVVTLFRPIYVFFEKKLPKARWLATLIAVISVLFTVLVPLSIFVNMTVSQFSIFYQDINKFLAGGTSVYDVTVSLFEQINAIFAKIPYFEYRLTIDSVKIAVQENIAPVANTALDLSVNIGVGLAQGFPLVIVLLYVLWYGFPDYDRMLHFVKRLSPLPARLDALYMARIVAMLKGIVSGTFTIAAIQAIVAAISLWIIGVPYVLFWAALMFFFSIVPLGTSFVTVPMAIVNLLIGNVWQAIFIFAVQFGVTSNIDNILRPMLVPKEADIHPVLLLLSFIGGIQVFGAMGLLYGPLIMVIMITSFEVFQQYFKTE